MEITILDGRRSFYQWDLDRKLQVEDAAVEQVHFAAGAGKALVCPVYEKDGRRLADVPNILLQAQGNLRLFAVAGNRTLYSCIIPIHPREKPDDYIYTETEVWTVEQAVDTAWQKLSGDMEAALDGIIAIQRELMGGGA